MRLIGRIYMAMSKGEERTSKRIFEDTSTSTEAEKKTTCLWGRIWWKVAVVLVLVVAVAGIIAGKQNGSDNPAPESEQVGGTLEIPGSQQNEKNFPPDTVLATVNGEEVTLTELESVLEEMPQQYRSAFRKNRHGLLNQLIAREVLLQKAHEGDAAGEASEGTEDAGEGGDPQRSEDERISSLLQKEVLADIEVSEQDVKAFYEKNKDQMPAGRSFEELEDSLRSYARQEKQSEAVDAYLKKLREEATITRNEEWVEAQKAKAADNPLDRALQKDVPVVADFGRGTCVPCKMMKPILDKLKEEYKGRAEILIIETDKHPAITQRVGIRAVPTQIFYDAEGNGVDRHQGFMSREAIVKKLEAMGVK
jgi:thioredoxin 1